VEANDVDEIAVPSDNEEHDLVEFGEFRPIRDG
jgi:hypothetical protein